MLEEALDKIDDRMIDVAEQTVINALETCDVDHNKAFVKGALRSALKSLLLSIMEDSSGIRESFEEAIVQVATAPKTLIAIASAMVTDAAIMAPIAKFVAQTVKKEVEESVKDLVLIPPSPLPSGSDSSSDESKNDRRNKAAKKKSHRGMKSLPTSHKGTWSMKGSLKDSSYSPGTIEKLRDRAPKLKVLHATDSQFRNVVNYKTYHLINLDQNSNGKLAARTGKYAKRMETMMKVYKFDDKDPITILRFLAQFKRACDAIGVSKGTALWIMPTFMKDGPAFSLTVRMTPHGDGDDV